MSKLAANIVKGIIRRLQGREKKATTNEIPWLKEKILKHREDRNEKQVTLKDITVVYKRPYEVIHTYKDIFVNEIYKFTTDSTKPLIIDCGANIGMSVLYFKKLYPAAKVIAFEPDPEIFNLLEKNIAANNLTDVDLNQAAVWVENGTINFSANASEASHIIAGNDLANTKKVQTLRLADLLQIYKKIDFLKVDIEGAEWKVMLDCAPYLSNIKNMFIEYHGKVNETNKLADLMELFHNAGFQTYIKTAADNLSHPFVNKTTNTVYDVQLNIFCYK